MNATDGRNDLGCANGCGRLRLMADGRELWSHRMSILPERRISLPTDRLPREGARSVEVDFAED